MLTVTGIQTGPPKQRCRPHEELGGDLCIDRKLYINGTFWRGLQFKNVVSCIPLCCALNPKSVQK